MRIPAWTQSLYPQDPALVQAIEARRGGELLNLDRALLWSEPLARGWNVYLKAVRSGLSVSADLRELAICTVALLTGANYEYHHHAPDFLAAGGTQAQLDALQAQLKSDPRALSNAAVFTALQALVVQYAAHLTLDVRAPDSVFNALQTHLSTTEVVEITSSIATYNMVARFLLALQVQPEEGVHCD